MTNKQQIPINKITQRPPIYVVIQQEIKDYIIQNSLNPGDRLPSEIELSGLLGVSRNSVREAVKALEMLHIVETRSGSGLFVGNFSFDALLENFGYGIMFKLRELDEILEVRFHVEYGMIPRVLEFVTPEQIERLRDIVEDMHKAAQNHTYSAENDRLFHQVLWENAGNQVVTKILDVFWGIFYQARKRSAIPEPRDLTHTYERHLRILEALERRDIKTLKSSMISHYDGIKERLAGIRESWEDENGSHSTKESNYERH